VAGAEFTCGMNLKIERAALNHGQWNFISLRGQMDAIGSDHCADDADEEHGNDD
jgi:hypothetical protein